MHSGKTGRLGMLAAAWLVGLFCQIAQAEGRFPQPQFEKAYRIPPTQVPAARMEIMERLDVVVLFIALSLASFLALRKRSRKGIVLLSLCSLAYFGFWRKGCVCPVGAIQNVTLAVTDPAYAIPITVLAFFLLPLFFALLFGRSFCGGVCPLGIIQDIVVLRPLRLPRWLSQPLSVLPYFVLAAGVLFSAMGAGFLVCRFDPFVGFFRLAGEPVMLISGAVLLLLGTVLARPYCRFFCPYGVLLNWMARFAKWHVTITPDECVQCRLCENACPFDAINKPTIEQPKEPRPLARRRLALILISLPILMAIGGAVGAHISPLLAAQHRTVTLAGQIHLENKGELQPTEETMAFRGAGTPETKLFSDAAAIEQTFRVAGVLTGSVIALLLGLKLLGLSLHRSRADYEPDPGRCLSCSRCFKSCPIELQRLKGNPVNELLERRKGEDNVPS